MSSANVIAGNSGLGLHAPISARARECIDWLREYAASRVNSRLIDERRSIPPNIVLDFGNQGLLAMQIPIEKGGKLGLSMLESLRVQRQLGAIDMTLAFFSGVNNALGVRPVWKFGSPTLHEKYLEDLASGRVLGAFALTEPGAGSNPLGITATAQSSPNGSFFLNGVKVWSGNAAWSGVINVIFNQRSTDGRSMGHVACCVPAELKGVRQGSEALTTGVRGMVQNAIFFDNAELEHGCMLGKKGGGLAVATDSMTTARLGIAATSVGGMWRALQLLIRYASRRSMGTAKLIDSDLVGSRIVAMHMGAQAADALVDQIAYDIDQEVFIPAEVYSAVKAISSEWLGQAVDMAIQTLGGRGYIETNVLPQMARDARLARIFEGPTDTLLMHVGQRLLGDPPALLDYMTKLTSPTEVAALQEHVGVARDLLFEKPASMTRIQSLLGHIGALYLAKACVPGSLCASWLDVQISRSASQMEESSVAPCDANDLMCYLRNRIGDIEQLAPDEDLSVDRYLRREFI